MEENKIKLTIGMAHYDDFDGAYFTIQDIRKELLINRRGDLLNQIEILVLDNNPDSNQGVTLHNFITNNTMGTSYFKSDDVFGTSATRNRVIENAKGEFVLVIDCHVLLCPVVDTIVKLFNFINNNPNTNDLYSGPLVYDNLYETSTHFNDGWGSGMWGKWGSAYKCTCGFNFSPLDHTESEFYEYVSLVDQELINKCQSCNKAFPKIKKRGYASKIELVKEGYIPSDSKEEPFEIFAQGLGLFLVRKDSWLGFNEHSYGFGGEECYIHHKYRQHGRRAICLPFLRWLHRFHRPEGVSYTLKNEDKVRNYIMEFAELGLDFEPVVNHFVNEVGFPEDKIQSFIKQSAKYYSKSKTPKSTKKAKNKDNDEQRHNQPIKDIIYVNKEDDYQPEAVVSFNTKRGPVTLNTKKS